MNTCKNCRFWKDERCDEIEVGFPEDDKNVWDKPRKVKGISVCVDMHDDSGFDSCIFTEPDFFCGNFKPKEL